MGTVGLPARLVLDDWRGPDGRSTAADVVQACRSLRTAVGSVSSLDARTVEAAITDLLAYLADYESASIYATELGVELAGGDLHSGTTWEAIILGLPADIKEEILAAYEQHGAYPVFRVVPR